MILLVPFRRLALGLGESSGSTAWVPLLDAREEAMAVAISRIMQSAARNTPWNSNCFPQAVVARMLLGFYGVPYVLFFGVTRDAAGAKIMAHAWVAAGRIRVTGGEGFSRFTVVGCFVSSRLAHSG